MLHLGDLLTASLLFCMTTRVSRNERNAALTVGTMCLIRRQVLEEVGGWAEWCVTEDSELATRIQAHGYASIYLTTTFGRGLIPETFAGYARQRFRWTYGPVQELKHHFRLFLPRSLGQPSRLSAAQKLHHLNHGCDHLSTAGLRALLLPLGFAIIASMLVYREAIGVPQALWVAATVGLTSRFVLTGLIFRVAVGGSWMEALGASVASAALNHTLTVASLWGLFTHQIPWRRTNKFPALPMGLGALWSTRMELLLGLVTLLGAGCAFVALPHGELLLMFVIGLVLQSMKYLAAPALALLADRDIRSRQATLLANGAEAALRQQSSEDGKTGLS